MSMKGTHILKIAAFVGQYQPLFTQMAGGLLRHDGHGAKAVSRYRRDDPVPRIRCGT